MRNNSARGNLTKIWLAGSEFQRYRQDMLQCLFLALDLGA